MIVLTPELIADMQVYPGYWYLATPYSKYADGMQAAFEHACQAAAALVRARVPVFCPIAHTHPIAHHGDIDPLDHGVWIPADVPFMNLAAGLLVVRMPGWDESYGIEVEIAAFRDMEKPVFAAEWDCSAK